MSIAAGRPPGRRADGRWPRRGALPFASTRDYEDWLKRMEAVPTVVDQSIALMREGVKAGNVPPKVLMQRCPRKSRADRR